MFDYMRKAQYHETDQMGIIHHANYVKWMEEARVAYLTNIGFGYRKMEELGVVSPVTGISLDYLKPVRFDDDVRIRLTIRRYTGVVLEFSYEFLDVTTGEVSTRAVSRHCFLKGNRPVSLKRTLPEVDALIRVQEESEQTTIR